MMRGINENRVFPDRALTALDLAYPETPTLLTHDLIRHNLLETEALVALAARLPDRSIEYNSGKLPIGIANDDVPAPELGITETIRTIAGNGYWMVIKNIEQDAQYAALLSQTLSEIAPLVTPRTGKILGEEGFIFLSSPGSVTPFHFDPEHNILLQVRGHKTMTVFPAANENLVAPEAHEAFHAGEQHRNLPWQDAFAAQGTSFELTPGHAVYVPVKAPHWVRNGSDVSVSLSITWRSEWSYAEADARTFNRMLRRAGLTPKSPGRYPQQNMVKAVSNRIVRRARSTFRLDR